MRALGRLLLLCQLLLCLHARTGVDISTKLSVARWKALFSNPADNRNFAIAQAQFYNNTINVDGLNSLTSAWKAGIADLSVYMYPCISASKYALNRICPSASVQLNNLISSLKHHNIHFFNRTLYPDASLQDDVYAQSGIWNLSSTTIVLNRLFVNIEDIVPNHYFASNHSYNLLFMVDLVQAAQALGISIGIYTSLGDWNNIMTDQINKVSYYLKSFVNNPFADLALWTPRYDQVEDMSFFGAGFANWTSVAIKQMTGGTKDLRRIGSSRVCADFIA
jgi:hypothetical protein